jgi:hypothetical protein
MRVRSEMLTLERVLEDFAQVASNETHCTFGSEVRIHRDDPVYAAITATQSPMMAMHQFNLSKLAITHARDTTSFLQAMLDLEFRPFVEDVKKANEASRVAWLESFQVRR